MTPDMPVENVLDLAWLLMKARHIRIAVEEAEGIEFVSGLPLKHPLHLPGRILSRRTGPGTRYDLAGAQLHWLGEHYVADRCVPTGLPDVGGTGEAVVRSNVVARPSIRHN